MKKLSKVGYSSKVADILSIALMEMIQKHQKYKIDLIFIVPVTYKFGYVMRVDRELQKKYEAAAVQCSEYTAVGGCSGLADALWV